MSGDHRALVEQARANPLAKELRWLASHDDLTLLSLHVESAAGKGVHMLAPDVLLDFLNTFARLAEALERDEERDAQLAALERQLTDAGKTREGLLRNAAQAADIYEADLNRLREEHAALLASQAAAAEALARAANLAANARAVLYDLMDGAGKDLPPNAWVPLLRSLSAEVAVQGEELMESLTRELAAARAALIRIRDLPGADDAGGLTWLAGRIAADALSAEVAVQGEELMESLTRELAAAREQLRIVDQQRGRHLGNYVETARQLAGARAMLAKYGRHQLTCDVELRWAPVKDLVCTCGLSAALAPPAGAQAAEGEGHV